MELINVRVVTEGLGFPEGPVAFDDGSVVVVELMGGRVTRCLPDGRKISVAEVGGGPNGAAVGPDGALYICNNGYGGGAPPSIQRIDLQRGRIVSKNTGIGQNHRDDEWLTLQRLRFRCLIYRQRKVWGRARRYVSLSARQPTRNQAAGGNGHGEQ